MHDPVFERFHINAACSRDEDCIWIGVVQMADNVPVLEFVDLVEDHDGRLGLGDKLIKGVVNNGNLFFEEWMACVDNVQKDVGFCDFFESAFE